MTVEAITPLQQATPKVEFGQSYADIANPTTLFEYDKGIGQYEDLLPAHSHSIPEQPIARSHDWGEESDHALRAVFNYRGRNFGVAETTVEGQPFAYITRFGEGGDRAQIMEGLGAEETDTRIYDYSDRDINGEPTALLTLHRNSEGGLELVNESVWQVRVGAVSEEQVAEREHTSEGFTLKSVYRGLKRLFGRHAHAEAGIDQRKWDSKLTDNIHAWKPESFAPAQLAHWKRVQAQQ